jgi:tetratricopeptide (TPR) repeat protein
LLLRSDERCVISAGPDTRPAPTTELELDRIRDLTRGRRYAEALVAAQALAASALTVHLSRDVLYLIAANQRCLNRVDEALATLERLEQQHPRYSRLFQERGYCFVTLRNTHPAIAAFQRGVSLNPALLQSWSMLVQLYGITGDAHNAATAAGHVSTLTRLPPEVVRAGSLFSDGDLAAAEQITTKHLRKEGGNVEALRLLGRIRHQRQVLDEAEHVLAAALHLAPDYHALRLDYIRVLLDRQKYARARTELDTLLQRDTHNRELLALYATAVAGLGEHDKAVCVYRELLAVTPAAPELHLMLAHSLQTTGQSAAAIDSCRAAINARPGCGDAWWSLANLKTYRFQEDEIARMHVEEALPGIQPVDRYHLCFALGKALEDRGDFAQSWQYYERGNALKRAESPYHAGIAESNARDQMDVCTARFFATRTNIGAPDPDPIFIVGLPRSGSTLIEQILASHSRVAGTQELPDIQHIALELRGYPRDEARYPAVLAELTAADLRNLGERYLASTRVYRTGKPFFIDKMPNNFRHLGLIHLMLPNARVIDVRREPMACCWSNLKQLFAGGQEFSYGMEELGRYYRTYLELMRHWDEVLPGRVLRVHYEDVVNDLEGQVRRLLAFCGCEFEPACVEFYKTRRSVRTASSEQVRQPIFRSSLDQWRHYEPWLTPLRDALGDASIRYRE